MFYIQRQGEATLIPFTIHSALTAVLLIFIPESPSYHHFKWNYKTSHEIFWWIRKCNWVKWDIPPNLWFHEEDKIINKIGDPDEKESRSIITLIKNWRSLLNLSSMSVNWIVISFSWYIMGFYVHYFHGNMYLNGILLGLADVFANILTRSIQFCSTTRLIFLFSFIYVAFVSVIYLIFSSHYIAVPICIVSMRAGLTMAFSLAYFGNYEYFLPQFTSTVFGATNIPAWIATILCPLITEMIW